MGYFIIFFLFNAFKKYIFASRENRLKKRDYKNSQNKRVIYFTCLNVCFWSEFSNNCDKQQINFA